MEKAHLGWSRDMNVYDDDDESTSEVMRAHEESLQRLRRLPASSQPLHPSTSDF